MMSPQPPPKSRHASAHGEVSARREAAKARKVELRSLGLEGGMATEAAARHELRKAAPLRQREPW